MARIGRRSRLALAVTLGLGAVVALAAPASAHDFVVSSTPADGETLTALPAAFSVTANEALVDFVGDGTGFGIQVTDAAGRFYGDGCVSLVDTTMSMPATLGEAGDYTMVWQLISSDSHPVSGTVAFSWAPGAGAPLSDGSPAAPVCGEVAATPDPTMTTQAEEPSDAPVTTAEPAPAAGDTTGTLLWLGGAALAIVAAVGVTLLLVRPKKAPGEKAPGEKAAPGDKPGETPGDTPAE